MPKANHNLKERWLQPLVQDWMNWTDWLWVNQAWFILFCSEKVYSLNFIQNDRLHKPELNQNISPFSIKSKTINNNQLMITSKANRIINQCQYLNAFKGHILFPSSNQTLNTSLRLKVNRLIHWSLLPSLQPRALSRELVLKKLMAIKDCDHLLDDHKKINTNLTLSLPQLDGLSSQPCL